MNTIYENDSFCRYQASYWLVLVKNAYKSRILTFQTADIYRKKINFALMIQLCTPGDDAYTVRYYNRVSPVITAAV